MMKNNIVTKGNKLILARYMMTVAEQRLLLACISQINSITKLEANKEFTLTIDQAQDIFYTKGNSKGVYRDLKKATKRLFDRKIEIELDEHRTLLTRFVQSAIFNKDAYSVSLRFADEVIPYLSSLTSKFTQYKLENIAQLTSEYAIRIYELIVSWSGQNQPFKEMTIDDFKALLAIEDKYERINDFKKYVLNTAINQINENTDYTLNIELKKKKRSFHWIQLSFNRKPEAVKADAERRQRRNEKQTSSNINTALSI